MATSGYMAGRKQYARPQAMLWSDTPGTINDGVYVPSGYEKQSNTTGLSASALEDSFIILSDHNRSEISVNNQRFEQRQRMINGTMRSYHIADKLSISTGWTMLPSRAYSETPYFNQTTGLSSLDNNNGTQYTADGGAGGVELLDWYENHKGPFWVFLSYDKYNNFGTAPAAYSYLPRYSQVIQMYISNFEYSVVKRGATNHDLWNVSVSLDEV